LTALLIREEGASVTNGISVAHFDMNLHFRDSKPALRAWYGKWVF
jgi:hypothetical protein